MGFKLGDERRDIKSSENVKLSSGSSAIRYGDAGEGALAQANMDGSIDIDPSVDMNSPLGRRIIKHEQCHLNQIKSGRAAYGDGWVMWEGKTYFRKEENGQPVIDGPSGRWPEGDPHHPWEQEAIEAENN